MSHVLGTAIAIAIVVVILVPQLIEALGRRLYATAGGRLWAQVLYYLIVVIVAIAALKLLTPGPEAILR